MGLLSFRVASFGDGTGFPIAKEAPDSLPATLADTVFGLSGYNGLTGSAGRSLANFSLRACKSLTPALHF